MRTYILLPGLTPTKPRLPWAMPDRNPMPRFTLRSLLFARHFGRHSEVAS